MLALSAEQLVLLNRLVEQFYTVVPERYQTYCSLTSRISQAVLGSFGIAAELQPCQLWFSTADHQYALGFTGSKPLPGKWDGHVICVAGDCFVDAATRGIQRDFGIECPAIIAAHLFGAPSQALARTPIGDFREFWWFRPPPGVDPSPPDEPNEVISELASALSQRLTNSSTALQA